MKSSPLLLCVLVPLSAHAGESKTALTTAAEKCDLAQVQAALDKGLSATSGVEVAYKTAMAAKRGTPKAAECFAVLDALFGRGARPDHPTKNGSLVQEAMGEDRSDLAAVLLRGHAMDCEAAAKKVTDVDVDARNFAIDVVLPRCDDGAEALTSLLTNSDDDLKRQAVNGLGFMGQKGAAAAPALIRLMNSGMSELALCAAESLTRIQHPPDPAVEAHLSRSLTSRNDELINRSLLALSAGGLGKTLNPNTLLALVGQNKDEARSNAAMEVLIANGDAYASAVPPIEKKCPGVVADCRTEPCQIAGDFDGDGKLDVARLFAQASKGESGVAFVLGTNKCVKWVAAPESFSSWRLERATDGKGTALVLSGGKLGDADLYVRSGQPKVDVAAP